MQGNTHVHTNIYTNTHSIHKTLNILHLSLSLTHTHTLTHNKPNPKFVKRMKVYFDRTQTHNVSS